MATVLNAAGAGVLPEHIQPLVYLPGNKGSLQAEMLAAASHYGYLAVPVPPDLDSLLQEFEGRPVTAYAANTMESLEPGDPVAFAAGLGISFEVLLGGDEVHDRLAPGNLWGVSPTLALLTCAADP